MDKPDSVTFSKDGEMLRKTGDYVVYKPKYEAKKDRLKIIIIGNGTNKHFIMPYEPEQDITIDIEKIQYNVPVNKIMVLASNIFQTMKDKLNIFHRIRRWYIVFFKEKESEPLEFKNAPESKITAINLSEIVFSKVIGLGVASLFRKKYNFDFNWKLIAMVAVVVGVMIGVFIAWQQGIFSKIF